MLLILAWISLTIAFNITQAIMKDEFKSYIKNIEVYINRLYNCTNKENMFFLIIFHVIKSFLNEQGSRNLFIKIPVHELGLKPKDHEQNWTKLQEIVNDAICLATAEKQMEFVKCPKLIASNENVVVYCHNDVSTVDHPQFYKLIAQPQPQNGVRPKLILDGNKYKRVSEAIRTYNDNKDCIFKMKAEPSSADARVRQHVESVYNRILGYHKKKFDTQYNSALIVGFNDQAKRYERTYSNVYFESPVAFANKFECNLLQNDIICFIGDRKYNRCWDDVQRGLGQNNVQKAIFIGSYLEGFKESETNRFYGFSIREMYHWFANGYFPEPCLKRLSFPWLEDRICEINDIIGNIPSINDEQRKRIISYALWNCAGMKIHKVDQNAIDNLSGFIYENTNITNEEEDLILDWYKTLCFKENTPKLIEFEKMKTSALIVPLNSYERKLKSYLKNNNKKCNTLVFDVYNNSVRYNKLLTDVWMHMPVAKLYFMSYFSMNKLSEFIRNEMDVCNGEYREKLLNGIKLNTAKAEEIPPLVEDRLSNYFNDDLFDEYSSSYSFDANNQHKYQVTTEDEQIIELIGDVVVGKTIVPLSEISEYYNNEDFPLEISYYEKHQDFDLVFEIIKNFPKGRDVAYYSRLWKEILRDYCLKEFGGNYKRMMKEHFPFLSQLQGRQYVNPDATTDFPNAFSKAVRRMRQLGLIDELTGQYLISAKKANSDSRKMGVQLKASLYHFMITGEQTIFLASFDEKSKSRGETLTSYDLLKEFIKTIKITNIATK